MPSVAPLGYDAAPARRAHRALELALARWREHAALPYDPPYADPAELEAFVLPAQAYVVEVLTWMRGLDAFYLGQEEGVHFREGYETSRSQQQMGALLQGARFAVNKSLHLLVAPVHMPAVQLRGGGMLGPPPKEPVIPPAVYLWPDLSGLPVAKDQRDLKLREAYAARFCYQPV